LSPDYQRGYIWSNEYKDKLILSIILNYPIGSIVINQLEGTNLNKARSELVDGKQRLATILRFIDGGQIPEDVLLSEDTWFKLSPKVSEEVKQTVKNIVNDDDNPEIVKMMRVKRIAFKDLPRSIQDNINSYSLPVYTMTSANTSQIREYFKVLQNQEKLRAGEIINALPDNPLVPFFSEISDSFLKSINYQNLKRAEFEKTYYAIIGLWFKKIQINCEDRKIIEFVEKLESLNDEQVQILNVLNENLNYISALNAGAVNYKMSKRTLKLILGMSAHQKDFFKADTLSKLDYICRISSKLAAFNSSESDENSFRKYFADEYSSDPDMFISKRAPRYRELYTITARSKPKTDFCLGLSTLEKLWEEHASGRQERKVEEA